MSWMHCTAVYVRLVFGQMDAPWWKRNPAARSHSSMGLTDVFYTDGTFLRYSSCCRDELRNCLTH